MRLRVVCGLEVTIAIFCPTNRFTRVDFPAFGRPTTATNPEQNSFFSGFSSLSTGHSSLLFRVFGVGVSCLLAFLLLRTLPLRGDSLHLLANPHAQHFSLVCFQDFETMIRQLGFVTWRGHFAGNMAQQTCKSGHRLIRLVAELHAKQFLDVADWHAAAHD